MARLTRKSFRRKRILLGLCMFLSIAMISTGFAAWVISTDIQSDNDGNVNVGTVTDAKMEFDLVIPEVLEINFEPKANDKDGRVTASLEQDAKYENLKFEITGSVKQATYLKTVTFEFEVPATVVAAMDANYIEFDHTALGLTFTDKKEGETLISRTYTKEVNFTLEDSTGIATIDKITVEFKWGSKFGGMNPGEYYDVDPAGKAVEDAVMKATLEDFYKLVYGATDATTGTADGVAPEFKVTLKATAN